MSDHFDLVVVGTGSAAFALAMRHGLTAAQIKEPLYAYPSHGSNTKYML